MDFNTALDTRRSDLPRPKNIPMGTYVWTVIKQGFNEIKSPKGHWDVIEFSIRPVSAESDVDEGELAEYGALKSGLNRVSFMFTKDPDEDNERAVTMERLEKFLTETLRVDGSDNPDTTMKELLAASINCQFLGRAVWEPRDDRIYVQVRDLMPLN